VGEYFLPIRHQLVATRGATLATVRQAHSHVQALGQCRNTLRKLGLKPVTEADTAGSARMIRDLADPTQAAIASRLAAEIYDLDILAEDIEDETHNTTRFVVLSRQPDWAPRDGGRCITTLVFNVRNIPAALYKAMGGFATNGVNMTKLESYMLGGFFFATQFYADVEGHPDQPALRRALEELAFFSTEMRILGVYPADAARQERAPAGE
jgi:prephenate dehydratase